MHNEWSLFIIIQLKLNDKKANNIVICIFNFFNLKELTLFVYTHNNCTG